MVTHLVKFIIVNFYPDRCMKLWWQNGRTASPCLMNVAFHCANCLAYLLRESTVNEATKTMLLERQKEYKMAALRAKKQGDLEQARLFLRTSKVRKKTGGFVDTVSCVEICICSVEFCIFSLSCARS